MLCIYWKKIMGVRCFAAFISSGETKKWQRFLLWKRLTKKTFGATTYIVLGLRYNSHEIKLKEYVKLDYARTNLFDQMVSCHSFFCWKEFKGRLKRTGERTLLGYQETYRFTSSILPSNHFYWWYYRSYFGMQKIRNVDIYYFT